MGRYKDITGQVFGQLTALYRTDKKGADQSYLWHCKCSCGKECDVNGSNLRNGHTTSCGCKKKITNKENAQKTVKDLTNQKFGLLTALEPVEQRNHGCVVWKCQCDCGNIKYVRSSCLVDGMVKSCGCLVSWGEQVISSLLLKNNVFFETQKTFDSCRFLDTNALAKFDFYIENKYIVEFDGVQHFKTGGWATEEKVELIQEHDNFKNQWCKENNIPLIRIPYTHLDDLCLEDLLLETSQFIV